MTSNTKPNAAIETTATLQAESSGLALVDVSSPVAGAASVSPTAAPKRLPLVPGQVHEGQAQAGHKYLVVNAAGQPVTPEKTERQGKHLVVTLQDGTQVILKDFFVAKARPDAQKTADTDATPSAPEWLQFQDGQLEAHIQGHEDNLQAQPLLLDEASASQWQSEALSTAQLMQSGDAVQVADASAQGGLQHLPPTTVAQANTGTLPESGAMAETSKDMAPAAEMGGMGDGAGIGLIVAGVGLVAALGGGGGGGGGAAPAVHNQLAMYVTGGPIANDNNLEAIVYKVVDGKATTTEIGRGEVGVNGAVNVDLGSYTGLVKVVIREKSLAAGVTDGSAVDPKDFADDITGKDADVKQGVDFLTTYVNVGGNTSANLNHLTSAISQLAELDSKVSTANLSNYNAKVATVFGLTDAQGKPIDLLQDINNGAVGRVADGNKVAVANAMLFDVTNANGVVDGAVITLLSNGGSISDSPGLSAAGKKLLGISDGAGLAVALQNIHSSVSATETNTSVASFTTSASVLPVGAVWSLGEDADSTLFNINPGTGALTFKTAPDYEVPKSLSKDNFYKVSIVGSVGTYKVSKVITVEVKNIDEAGPVFSSAAAVSINENIGANQVVYTASAEDKDYVGTASVTYSLKPGGDAAAFTIDPQTGKVTLKDNPDFEVRPTYSFTVTASDGATPAHTTEKPVSLTVTDVNEHTELAAGISGNGGKTFVLNQSSVMLEAYKDFTDPEGTTLTYRLTGTLPAGLTFNSATGVISGTPSAETTAASMVTITADDGFVNVGGADASRVYAVDVVSKPVVSSISVSDADTAPANTYGKGGQTVTVVITLSETVSAGAGQTINGTSVSPSFSAGGSALTNVAFVSTNTANSKTTLTYTAVLPASGNADTVVLTGLTLTGITLTGATSQQAMDASATGLTVAGAYTLDNAGPAFAASVNASYNVAENTATGAAIFTATATDAANHGASYALTGTDAGKFNIDASTGAVSFKSVPNFEAPGSGATPASNAYSLSVVATDTLGNATTKAITVNVTDVNEHTELAAGISGNGGKTFVLNQNTVTLGVASDFADPEGATLTYRLTGTLPAGLTFNSATGVISGTPSAETTAASMVTITADDGFVNVGGADVSRVYAVDVVSKPVVSSISVSDADTAPANTYGKGGQTVSIVITLSETVTASGGTISTSSVVPSFSAGGSALTNVAFVSTNTANSKTTLTYTAVLPASGNADTVVLTGLTLTGITLTGATSQQAMDASATGLTVAGAYTLDNAGPAFAASVNASYDVPENTATGAAIFTATATDAANHGASYALTGTDAGKFNIDASTGAVSFKSVPNFEAPGSGATPASNAYSLSVVATDTLGNATTKAITVNVTDVNEPTIAVMGKGSQTFILNQSATTLQTATDFTDPDANATLTYVLAGTLPAGLSFNTNTGVISGSPTAVTTAAAMVTITASDGVENGVDASRVYDLNVVNKPTIASITVSDADSGAAAEVGKSGAAVTVVVSFSEAVQATGTFTLANVLPTLTAGGNTLTVTGVSIPSGNAANAGKLVITATLPAGNASSVALTGLTFANGAGIATTDNRTFDAVTAGGLASLSDAYNLDNTAPNIATTGASSPALSLASGGTAVSHDIKAGDTAVLTIPLGEAASGLVGLPTGTLATIIKVGGTGKNAVWSSSGSNLLLTYTVGATDSGAITVDSAVLKSTLGNVTDLAGNAITFGGSSAGTFSVSAASNSVDTTPPSAPTVAGLSFSSTVATPASHTQTVAAVLNAANNGTLTVNDTGANEIITVTLGTALSVGDKLQWSVDNGTNWTDASPVGTGATVYTAPFPVDASTTTVTVKFHVADAAGNQSSEFGGTLNIGHDNAAPTLSTATVNGATLTLTFSEPLGTLNGQMPTATDFAVAGNTVTAASVSGSTVVLTLGTAYTFGQTAGAVSYTNDTDVTDVQDMTGNEAASFTGQAVTNNTPDIPALAGTQNLRGLGNLDVTSKLVLPFNQNIALGSGKIFIKDDMGAAGMTTRNTSSGVANNSDQDVTDNDVSITLSNGTVTGLTVGSVDYTALGTTGMTADQLNNSVKISGDKLIIDIAPAKAAKIASPSLTAANYGSDWTFDFDFGSNYHIEFEAGIVTSATDPTRTNGALTGTSYGFTTVTPSNAGAASQKMTDTGALANSYSWFNGHQGNSSSATTLDFGNGPSALVIQAQSIFASGTSVTTKAAVGGNVIVNNFDVSVTHDDLIYYDNGGDMALETVEGTKGWGTVGATNPPLTFSNNADSNGISETVSIPAFNLGAVASANGMKAFEFRLEYNAVIFG